MSNNPFLGLRMTCYDNILFLCLFMYHISTKLLIVKIYCVGYLSCEKQNFVSLFCISDTYLAKENMSFFTGVNCCYFQISLSFMHLLLCFSSNACRHIQSMRSHYWRHRRKKETSEKGKKKILRVSSDNMGFFFLAVCVCVCLLKEK